MAQPISSPRLSVLGAPKNARHCAPVLISQYPGRLQIGSRIGRKHDLAELEEDPRAGQLLRYGHMGDGHAVVVSGVAVTGKFAEHVNFGGMSGFESIWFLGSVLLNPFCKAVWLLKAF